MEAQSRSHLLGGDKRDMLSSPEEETGGLDPQTPQEATREDDAEVAGDQECSIFKSFLSFRS